jgi:hypothetical protein
MIRVKFGRNSVETGHKDAMYEKNHELDDFFEAQDLPFLHTIETADKQKHQVEVTKPAIIVKAGATVRQTILRNNITN